MNQFQSQNLPKNDLNSDRFNVILSDQYININFNFMKQHSKLKQRTELSPPEEERQSQQEQQSIQNESSNVPEEEMAEQMDQEQLQQNNDALLLNNDQDLQNFKNRQTNRGVCYLSRIPPYMKPNYIRRLLSSYLVERIYLLAESDWTHNNRVKRGGNKKVCFREGWVQFGDKRMAKLAALTLNGQKMVAKKGNFYSQDLWNIKYLPKFKWHHLTERLAHEERLKKERLKVELEQEKKIDQFYSQNLAKSKQINSIVKSKQRKGKEIVSGGNRKFQQFSLAQQIKDE